jgi:hypothetical protein
MAHGREVSRSLEKALTTRRTVELHEQSRTAGRRRELVDEPFECEWPEM